MRSVDARHQLSQRLSTSQDEYLYLRNDLGGSQRQLKIVPVASNRHSFNVDKFAPVITRNKNLSDEEIILAQKDLLNKSSNKSSDPLVVSVGSRSSSCSPRMRLANRPLSSQSNCIIRVEEEPHSLTYRAPLSTDSRKRASATHINNVCRDTTLMLEASSITDMSDANNESTKREKKLETIL
jgi:hypothetical protein